MDPNKTLAELLAISNRVVNAGVLPYDAMELAELVLALNTWISSGGFLPDDWTDEDEDQGVGSDFWAREVGLLD